MDTEQIRVASAVARHGSFAGAARALFVSQSTVSRQIASLEKILGTTIFVRGPVRTEPTEQGRAFLLAAQEVLSAVDRAVLAAQAPRTTPDRGDRTDAESHAPLIEVARALPEIAQHADDGRNPAGGDRQRGEY